MKRISFILFFVALITTVSCKKVELEPITPSPNPTPVFSAHVVVNGDTNTIDVGINATLASYHQLLGESSYIGTTFSDLSGNALLNFEFNFADVLSQNSFNQSVQFGSLQCYNELDIADVFSTIPISNYAWSINEEIFLNSNAVITAYGVYDVVLFMVLSDGTQIELKDRLTLGGVESYEPEISIDEVNPLEFSITALNYDTTIDSVRWEIRTGPATITTFVSTNCYYVHPYVNESFTVDCYYYIDGEVNYKSFMGASVWANNPNMADHSYCMFLAASDALPTIPRGKATYYHNGDLYTTIDGQFTQFQLTNVTQFTDAYSSQSYLKGYLEYSSYLYNASGDSIYVDVSSEIGFSEMPD